METSAHAESTMHHQPEEYCGWVGVLDILGFTELMKKRSNRWIYDEVVGWVHSTISSLTAEYNRRWSETDDVSFDEYGFEIDFHDIGFMFFADTIVLYTKSCGYPWKNTSIRVLSLIISDFLSLALRRRLLLRGAISQGSYLVDQKQSTIIGSCVVEAHEDQMAQEWAGVAFSKSTVEPGLRRPDYGCHLSDMYNAKVNFPRCPVPQCRVVQYHVPMKAVYLRDRGVQLEWAVQWEADIAILEEIQSQTTDDVAAKIQNTLTFGSYLKSLQSAAVTAN